MERTKHLAWIGALGLALGLIVGLVWEAALTHRVWFFGIGGGVVGVLAGLFTRRM
jgi:hypothetical protein